MSGTVDGLMLLSQLMPQLPTAYVVEAVAILCGFLDAPAFPPEQPLPSSLESAIVRLHHSSAWLEFRTAWYPTRAPYP